MGIHLVEFAAAVLLYTWAGYPCALWFLAGLRRRTEPQRPMLDNELPRVTVLIAAWNAEQLIRGRIRNVLEQDYPPGKLRVFVASDGSTDGTVEAALETADDRVVGKQFPRGGKSLTQNSAIQDIHDEVIVFTDADTKFAPGFLRAIVRPFARPSVGCVTGRLLFATAEGGISGNQNLYWRYELFLREQESKAGILATVTGACMALRRALFRPLPGNSGEDCIVPLDVVEQGFEVVHSDRAIALDEMPSTTRGELRARTRMTARNLSGIFAHGRLINPLLHPGIAWGLWSHKLLRWATPLAVLLFSLGAAASFPKYPHLLLMEAACAALCFLGALAELYRIPPFACSRLITFPFSFLLANVGFLAGILKFLSGRDVVTYHNISRPAATRDPLGAAK